MSIPPQSPTLEWFEEGVREWKGEESQGKSPAVEKVRGRLAVKRVSLVLAWSSQEQACLLTVLVGPSSSVSTP